MKIRKQRKTKFGRIDSGMSKINLYLVALEVAGQSSLMLPMVLKIPFSQGIFHVCDKPAKTTFLPLLFSVLMLTASMDHF